MPKDAFGRIMRDDLPTPNTSPELFEGVLMRRVIAFFIDSVIITVAIVVSAVVLGVLGILTLGIAWLGYFILVPGVLFAYYVVTLGSSARATVGMQIMDIVLTPTRSTPLDGGLAVLHPIAGWIAQALTPLVLFVPLFTQRRQMLHDLVVGTLMVRRSPMEQFWRQEAEHYGEAWADPKNPRWRD
ncbi:RDD family protein [Maritalea porphyrae]|uniref:RDD family protein n=1 Tax=Maritalea porphyrae TaxID=880732 RepID=UPI0022AEB455|nr:RDD family protein [Maritalea porphyrae]MCZ4270839.1 RDD family protein [Maritalea porphyrae]